MGDFFVPGAYIGIIGKTPGSWIWAHYKEVVSNTAAIAAWGYLTISCHWGIPAKADLRFGRCTYWEDGGTCPSCPVSILRVCSCRFHSNRNHITWRLPASLFPLCPHSPISPSICPSSLVSQATDRMTTISFLLSGGLQPRGRVTCCKTSSVVSTVRSHTFNLRCIRSCVLTKEVCCLNYPWKWLRRGLCWRRVSFFSA